MNTIPIPEVLECMHFVSKGVTEQRRIVKNYEFDLYLDGKREITLDGISHIIEEGSLIFRKPGQYTVGKGDYNMYLLTLDFSHSNVDETKLFRGIMGECQPVCDFIELDIIPPVFRPQHFEELKHLFEKLSRCSYPAVVDKEQQQMLIKEFLFLVLYDTQIYDRKQKQQIVGSEKNVAQLTHNYILEHFCEPIIIRDIAASFYFNENYLIRLFKKKYGITPNQYLLETRLIHARHLLLYSDRAVKDIALSCGFNTPSYFIKKFQERFQSTPRIYRENSNKNE